MAEATKKPGMLQRLGQSASALGQSAYSKLEYVDKKGSEARVYGTKSLVTGVGSTVKGATQLAIGTAALPIRAVKGTLNASAAIGNTERAKKIGDAAGNPISRLVGSIKGQAENLEKIPSFYKILFLIFFFVFFYKIIYDMGLFFGMNAVDMVIYMAWFGLILLFLSFISSKRSRLYN